MVSGQWSEFSWPRVPMLAITHCEAPDIIEKFGAKADYTLCAGQWPENLTYNDHWFGSASDYAKTFEKEYGYVPPYQAAESTAAVLVYIDALRRAGSLDEPPPVHVTRYTLRAEC